MAAHFRPLPDPTAPSALPRPIATLLGLSGNLIGLLPLPFVCLRWLVSRPPLSFGQYLVSKWLRFARFLTPVLFRPPTYSEAAATVKSRRGKEWDRVHVETVNVPPANMAFQVERPREIQPVDVPGFMITPDKSAGRGVEPAHLDEKIIIYFHGGGYTYGTPFMTPFAAKIASDTNTRVFAAWYRLSTTRTTSWPAPLLDALSAWSYITTVLDFPPSSITLMGDSAGGHLALALSTHLSRHSPSPGDIPGGLALCSPWSDASLSHSGIYAPSYDFLSLRHLLINTRSFLRWVTPEGARTPILSPALAAEGTFTYLGNTRVFVSVGEFEMIRDEIHVLIGNLKRDGVNVRVLFDEHGLHCGGLFPDAIATPGVYDQVERGVEWCLE